ncbi:hypothetical protein C0966_10095 [Bacillus methanolicus]|nr:hypothetical protein [Bacillus methanolicus]
MNLFDKIVMDVVKYSCRTFKQTNTFCIFFANEIRNYSIMVQMYVKRKLIMPDSSIRMEIGVTFSKQTLDIWRGAEKDVNGQERNEKRNHSPKPAGTAI